MFNDEIDDLKKNIDSLEERGGRGLLKLKDLKEQWADATTEAIAI